MAWFYLVLAGLLEIVWATAMKQSAGFTRILPTGIMLVSMIASFWLLAVAMRTLPLGTSYTVWVGIGASLTVAYAMITGAETASLLRIALIVGLVGCVIGLKLAH